MQFLSESELNGKILNEIEEQKKKRKNKENY